MAIVFSNLERNFIISMETDNFKIELFQTFQMTKIVSLDQLSHILNENLKDLERRKIVQISRFLHLRRYKSNGRNRSSKSIPLHLEALNSRLPIRLPWRECLFEKRKDSRIWCFDESSSEIIRFPFFFFPNESDRQPGNWNPGRGKLVSVDPVLIPVYNGGHAMCRLRYR